MAIKGKKAKVKPKAKPAKKIKKPAAPPKTEAKVKKPPAAKGFFKGGGALYMVTVPVANLLSNPDDELNIGQRDSQMLFGETFKSSARQKGWLCGVSEVDGYQGWVKESDLKPQKEKPTHAVEKLMTQIYAKPDFKTRPVMNLSFMSRITVESGPGQNGFGKVPGLGWVFKNHVAKIGDLKNNMDPLAAALKFLGSPYLYGGRGATGLDCSGLVQLSLSYCGIPCPRDTDLQVSIGKSVPVDLIQRGDIVFFKGHVGFMIDRMHVLNATARTMDTRIERLEDLAGHYKGIIAIRRITR